MSAACARLAVAGLALVVGGCGGLSWKPVDPNVTYDPRQKPATEQSWWIPQDAPHGVEVVGTLSWGYVEGSFFGSRGRDDRDVARAAADRGGDFWVRSGGDTGRMTVMERQTDGTLLQVQRDVHRSYVDVYREFPPAVAAVQDAPSQVEAGLHYMRYDRPSKAVDHYSRAIQLDPGYASAYACRGHAHRRLAEEFHQPDTFLPKAMADLKQALELNPDDVASARALYLVAREQWDLGAALDALDRLLERTPADREALEWRVEVRDLRGDLTGAAEDLALAMALTEDVAPALYRRRGQLKARNGDFAGAEVDLSKAIEASRSPHPDCFLDRGEARYAAGDLDGAMADFGVVAEVKDFVAGEGLLKRGLVKLQLGDLRGAKADFERGLRWGSYHGPHNGVALGMALWALGDEEEARARWESTLTVPNEVSRMGERELAYRFMARLLATSADAQLRDPERALELLRYIARDAKTAKAFDLGSMAAAQAARGDFQRAATCQAQAKRNTPQRLPHARDQRWQRVALFRQGGTLQLRPLEVFFDPGELCHR